MTVRIVRLAIIGVMTFIGSVLPRTVYAQNMSFSHYSDAAVSSDAQTVYTWISGYDYSTGCSHYDYVTNATLYTPTTMYSTSGGGLSASINSPTDDGNYYLFGSTTLTCSCFGGEFGAGGGSLSFGIRRTTSYYDQCDPYSAGYCYCTRLACTSGYATCGTGTISFTAGYDSCGPIVKVTWLVLDIGSFPGCTWGWATVVPDAGVCT